MALVKYVFRSLCILLIISCGTGVLYYLGNKILPSIVVINSANSYLYSVSLIDCIGISLFVFVFVYSIYLLAIKMLKTWNLVPRLLIAFISLITGIVFLRFNIAWGIDFSSSYVWKNLIVFTVGALCIPVAEYKVKKYNLM